MRTHYFTYAQASFVRLLPGGRSQSSVPAARSQSLCWDLVVVCFSSQLRVWEGLLLMRSRDAADRIYKYGMRYIRFHVILNKISMRLLLLVMMQEKVGFKLPAALQAFKTPLGLAPEAARRQSAFLL